MNKTYRPWNPDQPWEKNPPSQRRALARRERIARAFEEALRERREDLGAYAHAAEVALVLGAVAHARAHEIAEVVRGEPGHEHFRVRWEDDGHESVYIPAGDAVIRRPNA
jgi:hypothetical protein